MSVETEADLQAMLADHDPAVYGGSAIWGIFDHAYIDPLNMDGEKPAYTCSAADVSGIAKGDTITVNAQAYKVVIVQPDGTGLVTLILEEQ